MIELKTYKENPEKKIIYEKGSNFLRFMDTARQPKQIYFQRIYQKSERINTQ